MSGRPALLETGSLAHWRPAWDDLVAGSPLPTPFLRSWWLEGLDAPRRLFVLVTDGDTLLGGVALRPPARPGLGRYRLLGDGVLCPDHLDLVAHPEHRDEVVRLLADWFDRHPGLHDLGGVREDSLLARALPGAAVSVIDAAPYEPVDDGFEAWLERRGRSVRKRTRRTLTSLSDRDISLARVEPEQVPGVLDDFEEMHRARPDRGALMAHWPELRTLVQAGVDRDEAWIFSADGPDGRLAVLIGFVCGQRIGLYQSARRLDRAASGAGIGLTVEAVRRAAEAGLREVDLLRGDEAYKYELAGKERRVLRLRAAVGWQGRVLALGSALTDGLRRLPGRLQRRGAES